MLNTQKILQILLASATIALIAWIGERYRGAAGILATMPLTIPITLVIVFQNTGGDQIKMAEFAQAAVIGIVGTACFLLMVWWAITRHYPLPTVLVMGYAAWATVLLIERALMRLFV
jgi:hypothetical protein